MSVNGGTVVVRVEGRDVGLSDLLARINTQMSAGQGTIRNYATAMTQLDPAVLKAERELAGYARTLAAVAAKSGDFNGAQRILVQAMAQLTPATTSANSVQLQLQNTINQNAQASAKASVGIRDFAAGMIGLQSVTALVSRGLQEVKEAISLGNELEKTLTSFRILSGSQDKYEKNLAAVRQQQALFGGSLEDNVEGMSEFANLSNRTGIEIQKLTNLSRALATVDPAQGFKGAGIALKEFFSGNVTSLSRRFEIPKEVLNSINKMTDNKAKFEALSDALKEFGISEEIVTARAQTNAVAFDKLTGSMTDVKAAAGGLLAQLARPFAESWTAGIQKTIAGLNNLSLLFNQTERGVVANQAIFANTNGYDAYNAKIQELNAALPFYAQSVNAITPAQYNFAQALIQTGASAEQAFSVIQQFQGLIDDTQDKFERSIFTYEASAQSLDAFTTAQLTAAQASADGAVFAGAVADAVAAGRISIDEGTAALAQYSNAMELAANSATNQAAAQAQANQALNEGAIEALNTANASDQLKNRQQELMAVLTALSNGTITQSQAESILANQYSVTAAQLPGLINLSYQLAAARNAAAEAQIRLDAAAANKGAVRNDADEVQLDRQQQRAIAVQKTNEAYAAQQKALERETLAVGKAADQRAIYQKRLDDAVKSYGANSAAAIDARTELEKFDIAQQKAAKKGGSGAPKLTANEKLNTQLQDQQDKFDAKAEDAEVKHYDKLAEIYEDYAAKQNEQFRKNEVGKRRSRADFYSGLLDAPKGVDTTQFAAAYETAFAKAQEIAQTGKAKLAADFLELRQNQIEELQQLAEDAAKIQEQRKEGKIDKKDAQAQLAAIEARKKLIEDAQNEEQKQLLETGDENENRLNEQLAAENAAYEDQTNKIATQAARAADAKITHAERSKIAVDAENRSLADQETIYGRIAAKNGGALPNSPTSTPGSKIPTAASDTADKPVAITAENPIAVTAGEGLLIRQGADPFTVRDVDVSTAVSDLRTSLEERLSSVIAAIDAANNNIAGAVRAVEGAVGRIRISSPSTSVVQG